MSRLRRGLSQIIRWMVVLCAVLPLSLGREGHRAQAQDSGPFFGLRAEILFPSVIRLMAGVNEPGEAIETVTIRVSQGTQIDEQFTFVPTEHLLADYGSSVELVYDWLLAGGTTPVPFEPIDVEWSVRLADGQTAEANMLVQFEDVTVGTWQTAEDGPMVLHWFNDSLAGYRLQGDMMQAHALLIEHVQEVPPVEIVIYDPAMELCTSLQEADGSTRQVVISRQDGREYPCTEDAYRSLYTSHGIVFLPREQYGYVPLQNALITMMAREAYSAFWGQKAVPAWFAAGLAEMYHLQSSGNALGIARAAGRTESLIPLEGLVFDPPIEWPADRRALWDAQSSLMVLYLADEWGANAPFELAQRLSTGRGDFDTVFAAYTGRDLRVFWSEWQRWLFAGAAEEATRWTPYLPTTPTPTPPATATVIMPTATFTVVPSYTPSREFVATEEATMQPTETTTPVQETLTPTPAPR